MSGCYLKIFCCSLLMLLGTCLQAQWVDSASVTYNNDTLTIHIEGDIFILDPDGLKRISDTIVGDSVLVDVYFLPCSGLQMFTPYDTTFTVTDPFAPGINHLHLYTILNEDTMGSCYQYPNDQIVDTVNFTFNVPLSSHQPIYTGLNVYPNPADEFISVNSPSPMKQLSIMNSNGVTLRQIKTLNSPIHIAELPKGMYLIRVENEEGTFIKRFVKT